MVLITRQQIYRRGCTGPAWYYCYTVHAPDSSGLAKDMKGEGIDWARGQARKAIKDKRATGPVVEEWKKEERCRTRR